MGLRMVVTGADFSGSNVGFLPPVASGLQDWFLLGDPTGAGQLNRNPFNYASGGAGNGVILGGPAVSTNCLTLSGLTDSLQSQFVPGSAFSMLVAIADAEAAPSGTRNMHFGGTFVNGGGVLGGINSPNGASATTPRQLAVAAEASNNTLQVTTNNVASGITLDNNFRLCGLIGTSALVTAYDWTDNASAAVGPGSGNTFNPDGLPLEYGTCAADRVVNGFAAAPHLTKLAFGCAYNRAITAAEVTVLVPTIRLMLSRRGITV